MNLVERVMPTLFIVRTEREVVKLEPAHATA